MAVAQGREPYGDGYEVTRTVESSLTARFGNRRILLTTKDGGLICIAPADEPDVVAHFAKQAYAATDGGRVAVGRAHPGAGGVVHSYEEALSALDLADRMGLDEPVLYAADLLVHPVLTRDRQAMADLVRTVLGPLKEARGGAKPLLDTLTAYFDTGCVTAQAARRLSLSVRAMTYPPRPYPPPDRRGPRRSRPALHPPDSRHRRPPPGLARPGAVITGHSADDHRPLGKVERGFTRDAP